jgi:hypothetical protein
MDETTKAAACESGHGCGILRYEDGTLRVPGNSEKPEAGGFLLSTREVTEMRSAAHPLLQGHRWPSAA